MASPPPRNDFAEAAYQKVILDFQNRLRDRNLYNDILQTTSIEQVYDFTDDLQRKQAEEGHLRHLAKVKPFLDKLKLYTDVLDTFVQVKPDILALIWGPIKLLIQWTSTLKQSYDALIDTTGEIGVLIPEFQEAPLLFRKNQTIRDVMAIFFQDILDFYVVALNFFSLSRLKFFFEALWPKQKERIQIVISNIKRHTLLMREEVRREHIKEEHEARERALRHFEAVERSHSRHKYLLLETTMSPRFYNQKLHFLNGRLCEGTGKWLLEDDALARWLDFTDDTAKLLWLRGIPGAGKTFLAATAINQLKSLSRLTIFAFLSHVDQAATSSLSVIQSLIFQLAQNDELLQEMLCESGRDNLRNDLKVASSLFKTLLNSAGPVHIIVDGLDEIDKEERIPLLEELLQYSEDCAEARILICSRPEDDISSTLREIPDKNIILTESRNAGSIQAFVSRRCRKWLERRGFDENMKSKIKVLLAPLATQAMGMFLYADIVLKSITWINEGEEILKLLAELPATLHDAYARIFARINASNPLEREKARKVLGWVGCSPVPMTIFELEQALIIPPKASGGSSRVASRLNLVELCGPIVEIVDEYVQFVHFTAREYFLSPKNDSYINRLDSTYLLASSCITYLCRRQHDLDLEDDEFVDGVVHGDYRLHSYASAFWPTLVEQYMSAPEPKCHTQTQLRDLTDILDTLRTDRQNIRFKARTTLEDLHTLEFLKQSSREVYILLCDVVCLRLKSSFSFYRVDKNDWHVNDPLTVNLISGPLYETIDRLICPTSSKHSEGCQCKSLEQHYGTRPFKCPFLHCDFRRHGFKTKEERDSHTKFHDLPWKCDVASCEYAEIGFLSRRMRNDHLLSAHHPEERRATLVTEHLSQDDIHAMIFDLVRADRLQDVASLMQHFRELDDESKIAIRVIAAYSGSFEMLRMLCEDYSPNLPERVWDLYREVEYAVIESQNMETTKWLMEKALDPSITPNSAWKVGKRGSNILANILRENAFSVYHELQDNFVKLFSHSSQIFGRSTHFLSLCCSDRVIRATARQHQREELLLDLWKRLASRQQFTKHDASLALVANAKTSQSVTLAKFLLDNGADVCYKTDRNNFGASKRSCQPLQYAAREDSAHAAEFLKFLLSRGADPSTSHEPRLGGVRYVWEEKGPKGISKWLGISWDNLVKEVGTHPKATT